MPMMWICPSLYKIVIFIPFFVVGKTQCPNKPLVLLKKIKFNLTIISKICGFSVATIFLICLVVFVDYMGNKKDFIECYLSPFFSLLSP